MLQNQRGFSPGGPASTPAPPPAHDSKPAAAQESPLPPARSARIANKTSPAHGETLLVVEGHRKPFRVMRFGLPRKDAFLQSCRSEEHTSELQSRQYLVC